MLAMVGHITMLGLSRWTEKGENYHIIQKLFNIKINSDQLMVIFVANQFADVDDLFLLTCSYQSWQKNAWIRPFLPLAIRSISQWVGILGVYNDRCGTTGSVFSKNGALNQTKGVIWEEKSVKERERR